MMTYEVEVVELEPQPTAVVHAHVRAEEIPAFVGGTFAEVLRVLTDQGVDPAGPPFARYVRVGDGFDAEAGFPSARAVRGAGRVEGGELPGGTAARVLHRGDYSGVGAAYQAVTEWVTAHGYVVAGPPWESYLDGPEVAEPRTVVCLPCLPQPA